jgi:hypothetical protein
MNIIPKVSESMQELLTIEADKFSKLTGFSQRKSKMNGPLFAQTLIFGWWSNPDSTLEELSQTSLNLGIDISAQGIEQRFNLEAANFFKKLLDSTTTKLISSNKTSVKILNKFSQVFILDSSIVTLPDSLKSIWEGCGGTNGTNSAIKLEVRLDLLNGQMNGPVLENGKGSDKGSIINQENPVAGGLRIADLGYFSVDKLIEIDEQGGYFLSRWHVQTNIYSLDSKKLDIPKLLKDKTALELDVLLSAKKFPVRLIAIKVPENEIEKRKLRLEENSRKNRRPINPLREQLIGFNVYLTNADESLLTFKEAIVLLKSRWQIELLFKLWKSKGKIDKSRSSKPLRILTEIYAKLIAMIFQHWLLLITCWNFPDRSMTKAAKNIQRNILLLICNFKEKNLEQIEKIIFYISKSLKRPRINKRRKKPSLFQLLNQPQSLSYVLA